LPTPNEEDYFPTPTLTFDPKHQQQQENIQANKKQKCQENAVLLTNIEPHLLQPTLPSDPAATPSNSLLQSLTIPTPNQMIPQSQTIEPNPDETASDSPNQESTATETHDIAQHSSEPPPQELATSTPTLMTEPLLPQLATPMTPNDKPANWSQMSAKAKSNWRYKHKKR
jgi:hypothetical protein